MGTPFGTRPVPNPLLAPEFDLTLSPSKLLRYFGSFVYRFQKWAGNNHFTLVLRKSLFRAPVCSMNLYTITSIAPAVTSR